MSWFGDIWKHVKGAATGGLSYLNDGFDEGDADPLHLFSKNDSEKLADDQWEWQRLKYDENFQFQKEQYEYQKMLNDLAMQREDTAVQRRVADLKASGLSPTLAAGSAADSGAMHAGQAPQYEVGVNPKLEAAMFKQSMTKDMIELASSVLGNVANVARTGAETQLIKAQTGKLVGETPVDLRIKEELAELNAQLHSIRVDQAKQDLTNSEADYISKLWDHVAASDDHILKTTQAVREELGVKLDEQALRIGASEENIKKTEALIKGISLQLEEYQLKTETQLQDFYKNLGVPRGVHDKPAYAPFTLIRGLVEGFDKRASYLWDKASSGLRKIPGPKFHPKDKAFIYNNMK